MFRIWTIATLGFASKFLSDTTRTERDKKKRNHIHRRFESRSSRCTQILNRKQPSFRLRMYPPIHLLSREASKNQSKEMGIDSNAPDSTAAST